MCPAQAYLSSYVTGYKRPIGRCPWVSPAPRHRVSLAAEMVADRGRTNRALDNQKHRTHKMFFGILEQHEGSTSMSRQ
jgi:hypothetical protein